MTEDTKHKEIKRRVKTRKVRKSDKTKARGSLRREKKMVGGKEYTADFIPDMENPNEVDIYTYTEPDTKTQVLVAFGEKNPANENKRNIYLIDCKKEDKNVVQIIGEISQENEVSINTTDIDTSKYSVPPFEILTMYPSLFKKNLWKEFTYSHPPDKSLNDSYKTDLKSAKFQLNFKVVDTLKDGNCFFDSVRLAFQSIGLIITIPQLRSILITQIDEVMKKAILNHIENEVGDVEDSYFVNYEELLTEEGNDDIGNLINKFKKNSDDANMREANIASMYDQKKWINTDFFHKKVLENDWWADNIAIEVLGEYLKIGFIIIEYPETVKVNKKVNDASNQDLGIIVSYENENHYKLIGCEKDGDFKYIFRYDELPEFE
jgi:hypothetical protein